MAALPRPPTSTPPPPRYEQDPQHPSSPLSSLPPTPKQCTPSESTPGTNSTISNKTLADLADAECNVMVHLHSFQVEKINDWAPRLFGFIAFADRVDAKSNIRISTIFLSIRDY
ncbi:hypothetical protein F5B18DRAFT_634670 [Nemania serpens]|nr:hypothetical protein F5B18DRAFT_634670 [Nemania serpens]